MLTNAKRIFAIALAASMLVLVTGCGPNYEKMYKSLDVEHKNLVGLYENCQT